MHQLIANTFAYETLAAYLCGGRFPHALMIEGPAGCGKYTFALEAAQTLVCSAAPAQRPCGECRDCMKAQKNIHPDILTFGGEGGSRSFHIDVVREIRKQAVIRPNEAHTKAIILRNTQEMSVQAQNALLKLIEEPPGGVVFLLTCQNRAQMLETVRSRVQIIPLKLPDLPQAQAHLEQRLTGTEPEHIAAAVHQTGGNIGAALAQLENQSASTNPAADILYHACIGDELEALAALTAYERDRTAFVRLLEQMRVLLIGALLYPPENERLALLVQRVGRLRLMAIPDIIEHTGQAAAQNVNSLLCTTALCARIRAAVSGQPR